MKAMHLACVLCAALFSTLAGAKAIIGVYENASIPEFDLTLKAKIDTGARHSSLHAENIKLFKKEDRQWVSFSTKNDKGELVSFTKPVHRIAKIKRHNGVSQQRPVIITNICIANTLYIAEINLIDRSALNYPMLIGRSYLKHNFLVDVSEKYTKKPQC